MTETSSATTETSFVEIDTMFEDAGDVGGDIQAGPSYERRWKARNADGTWTVVLIWTYDAEEEAADGTTRTWVQTMVEAAVFTDPGEVFDTVTHSEITYWDGMGSEPGAEARALCEALTLEDVHAAADLLNRP